MEIIKSNKGSDKICYQGYMYTLKHAGKQYYTWRCTKKSSLNCPAILRTSILKTEPMITTPHNHIAEPTHIEVAKVMAKIKVKAAQSSVNPSQIYAEEVSEVDNNIRARMPLEETVKRTIRNLRTIKNPLDPKTIKECEFLDEWSTTGHPHYKRLLFDDNGTEAPERVVMFATDDGLKHLADASRWYMDGNFSLAPRQFQQLYVIRVEVNNIFITAVYCLLENKTLSTYEYMLTTLLKKCEENDICLDPLHIHVDFERAIITAIKHVLGEHVNIQGCFYHLTQSTYRKVQELGLQLLYKENEEFSEFCGKMDGLAFLPIEDVKKGMIYLRTIVSSDAEQLLDYFDKTYVNGTYRRIQCNSTCGAAFRNNPPLFPIPLWNVHDATINDEARTNNSTEGWNHRFSKLVGQNHPTVWTMVNKIRLEIAADETKLAQSLLGIVQKKRKINEDVKNKLKQLCINYNTNTRDIPTFLKAIAYTIRYR